MKKQTSIKNKSAMKSAILAILIILPLVLSREILKKPRHSNNLSENAVG